VFGVLDVAASGLLSFPGQETGATLEGVDHHDDVQIQWFGDRAANRIEDFVRGQLVGNVADTD
jgi:hypothetical protein